MICPDCKGQKEVTAHINYGPDGRGGCRGGWKVVPCMRCKGVGEVADEQAAWIEEGKRIRELRVRGPEGYRNLIEQARIVGIDFVTLSKMECGLVKPYTLEQKGGGQ